jgi:hypothetical protein
LISWVIKNPSKSGETVPLKNDFFGFISLKLWYKRQHHCNCFHFLRRKYYKFPSVSPQKLWIQIYFSLRLQYHQWAISGIMVPATYWV